jgi:opacity protein-like surface antigen
MKLIAIAAASAFLMLGTAHAQQASSPLYGELGYTFLKVKGDDGSKASPHALRGIIGYELHPVVAIEGMAAIGTRKDSFNDGVEDVSVKVKHAFGVFAKPKFSPTNELELFGRLGWVKTKFEASCPSGTCEGGSDSDFAYGLGLNYRFTPKLHVGIDYMRYLSKDGVKIDGVTLSVGSRF